MKRHLGLDVSTTCTGWAVLDLDAHGLPIGVHMGHIDLTPAKGLIDKSYVMSDALLGLHRKFEFDKIFIEENMQAFRPGASKADTILKLAKMNGIVTFLCHQVCGVVPRAVNVNKARKSLGMSLQREKVCGISIKDQIHRWVKDHPLNSKYKWPTKTLKAGPRRGQVVIQKYVYDMSDAFVIALAGPLVPE